MNWKIVLAYVTGSVDEEFLRRNEYLVAENCILRAQIPGRLKRPTANAGRWLKSASSSGGRPLRRSPPSCGPTRFWPVRLNGYPQDRC